MDKDDDSDATIPATPEELDVAMVNEIPGDDSVLIVESTPPPVITLSSDDETSNAAGGNQRIQRRQRIKSNRSPVDFVDLSNVPTPGPAPDGYEQYRRQIRMRLAEGRGHNDSDLQYRNAPAIAHPPIVATVDLSDVSIPGPFPGVRQHLLRNRLNFETTTPPGQGRSVSEQENRNPSVTASSPPAAAAAPNVPAASPPRIICPVCYEPLAPKEPYSTNCGHLFCRECISNILQISKKCPMCNKPLKGKAAVHRVFLTDGVTH
ncbi:uncharacterized protein LOC126576474 [Anopheles aquasalis]|uniref:uncharacterized protein LOC126576474 n=1 Tax=Anopheles aquasalis TaxID=42839 RepID=UPI00215AD045|nr:uncharacterized protein LOC126576474 [Anopheles aquasalis]